MTFTTSTLRKLRALNLGQDIEDQILAIFEEAREAKKKGCAADRKERGTRLPGDWNLPTAWREWALGIGLRHHEINREATKFKNYWLNAAGIKGIKLKWDLTWQNWCLGMLERAGRQPIEPETPGGAAPPEGPQTFTDATWQAIMVRYANGAQWNPLWGPEPGKRGCRVPDKFGQFPPAVDYEMGP